MASGAHSSEREVRKPTQARGNRTVAALRSAALKLLAKRDVSAITVAEIARRAGLSVGAFYHYYPSKEALFLDLRSKLFAETASALAEAFTEPVTETRAFLDIVRVLLKKWIEVAAGHRGVERAVIALSYESSEVAAALREQETVSRNLGAALLRQYADRLRPCDPDQAAACMFIVIDSVIARTMREPELAKNNDWLVDEAVRMIGRYLMRDELMDQAEQAPKGPAKPSRKRRS